MLFFDDFKFCKKYIFKIVESNYFLNNAIRRLNYIINLYCSCIKNKNYKIII